MNASSQHEITTLLHRWSAGDESALDQITPLVYDEIRRIAHHYMKQERSGHTLQTTALINEAYLRLVESRQLRMQDRSHFIGAFSRIMRHVLIDYARGRNYLKRGGEAQRVSFDDLIVVPDQRASEIVALDEALTELERIDPRKCRVVELRYFGGLSIDETAVALGVSPATIRREWTSAKAWLYRSLNRNLF